jgi:SAM-dependent methyltransferase
MPSQWVDIALFNASLHYATDLAQALAEAARVTRPHGCLAILDSPFYRDEPDGAAMVAEKRRLAPAQFGERAATLMGIDFVEFLTRARLERASANLGLVWRRIRVRYPIGYELRPLIARLQRKRAPSRFDLWIAERR